MGRITFPDDLNVHGRQKVTLFFMIYGLIVLLDILQFILNGCWDSVLSCNSNNVFINLFVEDVPTRLLETYTINRRWGELIFWVIHLTYAFGILEDADSEGFHNVIVNFSDMIL